MRHDVRRGEGLKVLTLCLTGTLRERLRLRIWTESPELQALPWPLTSWNGWRLAEVGWTFELAMDERSEMRVALPSPARVLVIAPTRCGVAKEVSALHAKDLHNLLDSPAPAITATSGSGSTNRWPPRIRRCGCASSCS